jgi:hypothetical protein
MQPRMFVLLARKEFMQPRMFVLLARKEGVHATNRQANGQANGM